MPPTHTGTVRADQVYACTPTQHLEQMSHTPRPYDKATVQLDQQHDDWKLSDITGSVEKLHATRPDLYRRVDWHPTAYHLRLAIANSPTSIACNPIGGERSVGHLS